MARSQSRSSRAFCFQKLAFCIAILTTIPVLAQPAGLDTGAEPEKVLAIEPETANDRFEAALLMVKLARLELGKHYISEILAMDLSDAELFALRDKHGTATFLSLANVEGLNPEASQLLKSLTDAVSKQTNDPAYIAKVLPKLAGSARERAEALTELRALGPYAVPPMLQAIENETISRDVLIFNLARMGEEAVPPIIGALSSPSNKVRIAASEVLGWLGGKEDTIWLYDSAFAPQQPQGVRETALRAIARIRYNDPQLAIRVNSYGVASMMIGESIKHLSNQHQWEMRYEDMKLIPVWSWNAEQATVVETKATRRHASVYFAERLAREAAEINPSNEDAPIVLLAAKMVRDIEAAGWDQPIPAGPGSAHDLAVTAGSDACDQILSLAIDNNIPAAALSAVSALSLNGSRSKLSGTTGKPVIIESLDFPHPRVQFAAAVTILQWEPQKSFKGSRRVVEVLTRAIQGNSKPDGVVIDPNVQRGSMTANLFGELGYETSIAVTGMDGFQIAAAKGDIELAVLHPNTIRWGLTQTIENLRADARTRNLPLVIYGPSKLRTQFATIQNRFQNVVFVNESVKASEIYRELHPVLAQISPPPQTQEQRTAQLREAAYWLRWIATSSDSKVFHLAAHQEVLMQATGNPIVADDALIALGAIAVPAVQQRFLDLSDSPNTEPNLRRRAALQLAFHIQRYGVLLTPAELDRLKVLASGDNAPELQTALSSVLGSLKSGPAAIRKLILDAPTPSGPVATAPAEE